MGLNAQKDTKNLAISDKKHYFAVEFSYNIYFN